VCACEPSQNSVLPVDGLKGQRGTFAITKKGHWESKGGRPRALRITHLRMVEDYIFVNSLTQAISLWQSIIAGQEIPDWFGTKVCIHDLDYKGVEENIVIE
jgi:hypothetical protein